MMVDLVCDCIMPRHAREGDSSSVGDELARADLCCVIISTVFLSGVC